MLSTLYVYIFPTNLNISLMLPTIRLLQNFYHYYHRDCRLLADGMRIFHLECCYCFITVLDRGPRLSHPWHSLRMCLYHILLHLYSSNTMPAVWWNIVLTFCHSTLNAVFTQQLSLADEGYESGSDTIDLPTPLWKTLAYTMFPAWNMPLSTQWALHPTVQ